LSRYYFRKATGSLLFPGVVEGLQRLRRFYRLALCTSASSYTVDAFFDNGVDREFFEFVLTAENVSAAKPSPEIYEKALELLGLPSSSVIIIEDSLVGVRAGLLCGANVSYIGGSMRNVEFDSIQNLTIYPNLREFFRHRLEIHEH